MNGCHVTHRLHCNYSTYSVTPVHAIVTYSNSVTTTYIHFFVFPKYISACLFNSQITRLAAYLNMPSHWLLSQKQLSISEVMSNTLASTLGLSGVSGSTNAMELTLCDYVKLTKVRTGSQKVKESIADKELRVCSSWSLYYLLAIPALQFKNAYWTPCMPVHGCGPVSQLYVIIMYGYISSYSITYLIYH